MEKVATTHFICEPFHADFSGKLTMGVLGNHLLNCAGQHASARGFGMARLNEEDHTWVLSRMAIEFEELPKQYEHFEIDTWVENVYRLFTDRNFAIRNHEGRIIGYARTVWAMIGVQSRKPLDLTTLYNGTISAYSCTERECPIEKTGRFKMLVTEPALSYTARYSDIDINGHVNSMRYIEHVMDLFDLDYLRKHQLFRLEIAYVSESYCGDILELYKQESESGIFEIETTQANHGAVVCRVKLFFK